MTAIKGEMLEATATDVLSADEEQVSEGVRHARICADLGKMAPRGTVVMDYHVEGRQSFCSPVRGIIFAALEGTDGIDLGERALQTTNFREQPGDPFLFDHLNELADMDRAIRLQPAPSEWHVDK